MTPRHRQATGIRASSAARHARQPIPRADRRHGSRSQLAAAIRRSRPGLPRLPKNGGPVPLPNAAAVPRSGRRRHHQHQRRPE
ncbi:hypothetical protein DPM13_16290 [Paracoccus mutanolyticus]|uniref:Uncharacterized protein n=1 Tax=Paracoccus mutanolyticus TaxID=1499308 RepID=A0ABM6WTR3_9RHOB|nr:hypothetical protein DPM13_16290 [Paracoccus mutanolyticus]